MEEKIEGVEITEEAKEEKVETVEITEVKAEEKDQKAKNNNSVHHSDYNKGETPTKKSDINMKYIMDYCAGHRKYEWFVQAVDNAGGLKAKGYAFKVKAAFINEFYPELDKKLEATSSIESIYNDFKAKAAFKANKK